EADQLRAQLALELVELRDPAGLDELLESRRDPGSDPAKLTDAPGADELVDGDRRLAHGLGRAAVGPRGVRARAGEVEQRRERLEAIGDRGVLDARRHAVKSDSRAVVAGPSGGVAADPPGAAEPRPACGRIVAKLSHFRCRHVAISAV